MNAPTPQGQPPNVTGIVNNGYPAEFDQRNAVPYPPAPDGQFMPAPGPFAQPGWSGPETAGQYSPGYPVAAVPVSPHRRPGPTSLAAALSVVLASALGAVAVLAVIVSGVALKENDADYGYYFGSAVSSRVSSEISTDTTLAVLGALVLLVLAVNLAWGAGALMSGTSNRVATAAHFLTLVAILIGGITLHPVLFILVLVPGAAIAGALAPTTKEFIGSRSGITL